MIPENIGFLQFAGPYMAFDGGPSFKAYCFVWSVWTYPIAVSIAGLFRKSAPWLLALPLLNIAVILIGGV